jgi:hypothetical protein
MWIILSLLLLVTGYVQSGPELSFWTEDSVRRISTSQEITTVYILFEFNYDITTVKTELVTIRAIQKKFLELKIWDKEEVKKEYFGSIDDAAKRFITATTCLGQSLIMGTQDTAEAKPIEGCIYRYPTPSENSIKEGMRLLNAKDKAILPTWTGEEFIADKAKRQLLEEFIFQYNSLSFDWEKQMCDMVSGIDLLRGGTFPEHMVGQLETEKCVGMTADEEILVNKCKLGSGFFYCNIDFALPKTTQEVMILVLLNYLGYQLKLPNNTTLVKEPHGTKLQLLQCSHKLVWESIKTPLCKIRDGMEGYDSCLKALTKEDTEHILSICSFTQKDPKPVFKLGNGGLLIQDTECVVTDNGNVVYQPVPFVIFSNKEIQVSLHEEKLIFPATNSGTPRILTSRLSKIDINMIRIRGASTDFWEIFSIWDYDEYIMFGLDIILIPFLIYAVVLGVRSRQMVMNLISKAKKAKKKQNFNENRSLLRQSRL